MEKNNAVSLKNIKVSFGEQCILDNLNLDIKEGEFLTLLGSSGCGKTTTLRVIAGFIDPVQGDVILNGKRINHLPAHKREVNTVFQKYALFNHLNVFENIAFGMRVHKKKNSEIKKKVNELLELVNLKNFAYRSITSLSGGQQQRIAIARALANEPKILLLDEPLAALDLKLRKDMQTELKKIQSQTGITFVFVTHDQEEALCLSDRVIVMDKGLIQQIGTPEDIYNEPANAFVADFIGESNIIDGVMLEDYLVKFSNTTFKCVDKGFSKNQPVDVVIRPEDVEVRPVSECNLKGVVTSVVFKGVHYEMIVNVDNFKWMIQSTQASSVGEEIGIYIRPHNIHVMKKSEYSGTIGDYSSFSDEFYEEQQNKGGDSDET